jgi:hypothetical protein
MEPSWYLRRLRKMDRAEVVGRVRHTAIKKRWAGRQVRPGTSDPLELSTRLRSAPVTLPAGWAEGIDSATLLAAADRLMDGRWSYFGFERADLVDPDWHHDPSTGGRAPADVYSFDVPYRDEAKVGNVKQLWELSRHHHLTVLAAAYAVSGDDRYAERAAAHVRSWLAANPFLSGVHWTSGIELGIRLISWVWTRRLLDGWSGTRSLFEDNDDFVRSVHHHSDWLVRFISGGTSANNHVVAEVAGLLSASCAFDWFDESPRWRGLASDRLAHELKAQTFASGLNTELASEYHGLTLELGLVAAMESERAGYPMSDATWRELCSMIDAIATVIDVRGQMPRQGDADDGMVLVVDDPHSHRWYSLLRTGAHVFGACDWWPTVSGTDVRTELLTRWYRRSFSFADRPTKRRAVLPDAGQAFIRTSPGIEPELWCRADAGPLGFLSIAAHGHADALSVEVRLDGVELLADPGTYCYHGEPQWRRYFRGTLSHNTLELGGVDQSVSGGPFLWMEHATSVVRSIDTNQNGEITRWVAEHHGYRNRLGAIHRRTVEHSGRSLTIVDAVEATHAQTGRLAWHFGPEVDVSVNGSTALASWWVDGERRTAAMTLPHSLDWTLHRAEEDPPLGWYSPQFGVKVPACTLIGTGQVVTDLTTTLTW